MSSTRSSEVESVAGPEGRIEVLIDFDDPDRALGVRRDGETCIEPSPIGIGTLHGRFPDSFELADVDRRTVTDEYVTKYGKRRERRHDAVEATYTFEDETEHAVELQVRVAPDGVAYRYRVDGDGAMLVFGAETDVGTNEWSGVRFPQETVSWNDFLFVSGLSQTTGTRTLPFGLQLFKSANTVNWEFTLTASVITMVPVIVLFGIFQNWIVEGLASGGMKGS